MNRDIFDKIMGLPVLRRFYKPYEKHKEVLLYIFFGGLATVVSISTFLLFDWVMNELIANALSWIITVGFAYWTNRTWVFRSQVRGKGIWKEMTTFYTGRLATLTLEELILLVFVTILAWNSAAVKIAAQIVVLVGNYIISKLLIFKKTSGAS